MNYVEEQKNELEALSEIYYNEIEVKSKKPPISFSIKVSPQASTYEAPEASGEGCEDDDDDSVDSENDDEDGSNRTQCPIVNLLFQLPPNYPDTKPSIKILDSKNLADDEITELTKQLDRKSEESLGEVMIFTLVSDVVEWLSSKAERESNEIEEQKDRKREELEAEAKKKCEGTPVTLETFLAWKAKFDAELLKARLEQQKREAEQNPSGQKRMTGREMFETDKALAESDMNFVEDLEQDQIEALMQNIDEADLDDHDGEDVTSDDFESGSDEDEDQDYPSDEDLSDESN